MREDANKLHRDREAHALKLHEGRGRLCYPFALFFPCSPVVHFSQLSLSSAQEGTQMIRIIKTGSGDAPHFFCDHCEQPIKDISLALYMWKQLNTVRWEKGQEPELVISPRHPSVLVEQGHIYTLHKSCADDFEATHGGNTYRWPWMELIDLLLFLIHNSGLTIDDLQKRFEERQDLWG
jgi:hypothetical protein